MNSKHCISAAILLLGAVCIFSGCRSATGYPKRATDVDKEAKALAKYFEPKVYDDYASKTKELDRTRYRNEVVRARLRVVNLYYDSLERSLTLERNAANVGVDTTVLLTALASTMASRDDAKILALISGGLVGIKGSVDKHLFYEQTLPALKAQMRSGRAAVRVKIERGLNQDTTAYSLPAALDDVDEYATAGSIPGAISAVSLSAGADAKTSSTKLEGILIASYVPDPTIDQLKNYVWPAAKLNDANLKKVQDYLTTQGYDPDEVPTIVNFPEFKTLRAEIINALSVP